jgi:hypothetical protein
MPKIELISFKNLDATFYMTVDEDNNNKVEYYYELPNGTKKTVTEDFFTDMYNKKNTINSKFKKSNVKKSVKKSNVKKSVKKSAKKSAKKANAKKSKKSY